MCYLFLADRGTDFCEAGFTAANVFHGQRREKEKRVFLKKEDLSWGER
jgi:hypothetical protein